MKYIIKDWAYNEMFNSKEFKTFEDAWDYLYEKFPNEDNFEDYFVTESVTEDDQ